jgi:hypothetical protein
MSNFLNKSYLASILNFIGGFGVVSLFYFLFDNLFWHPSATHEFAIYFICSFGFLFAAKIINLLEAILSSLERDKGKFTIGEI